MLRKVFISALMVVVLGTVSQVQADTVTWSAGNGDHDWNLDTNWSSGVVPGSGDDVIITGGDEENHPDIDLGGSQTILSLTINNNVCLESWGGGWTQFTITNGLINNGSLEMDSDGGIDFEGDVTNYGWLEVEGVYFEGDFNNAAGAGFEVYDGEFDSNFVNYGNVEVDPFSELLLEEETLYNYSSGMIQIYGGELTSEVYIDNAGTIKGFGLVNAELSLLNSGEITAEGGTLVIYSDNIVNTGILRNQFVSSLQIVSPADVNNVGIMEARGGGGIAVFNDLYNQSGGTIELMGGTFGAHSITQSAGATFSGAGIIAARDGLTIEDSAQITLTGPSSIYSDVTIESNAVLEISDGTTLVTGHTTNNGTIHMKGGRLIPQGGLTNNGTIIWEPGLYNNVADFNLDGQVNFEDFADFAEKWLWQAAL